MQALHLLPVPVDEAAKEAANNAGSLRLGAATWRGKRRSG
jgi:hypothetical protein